MLNKLIVIASLLLFCSCVDKQSTSSETEVQSLIDELVIEKEDINNNHFQPQRNNSWQGNLDGKYPVLIWCKEIDGVVTGSLFYTDQKNPNPILLAGTYSNNKLELVEHLADGKVTGVWVLEPGKHSIEGVWLNPITEKSLSVSMMKIDTSVAIYGLHKGSNVSGDYHYYYDDDNAPMGSLSVQQISKDSVVVSFENVGRGPAHNIGFTDHKTIELVGNTAIYSSESYGSCELMIKFFNEFAYVDYIDNKVSCGLGHQVYLNGTYVKLK